MPIEKLPLKAQPVAYKLRAVVMSDATLLVVIGIMALTRGITYLVSEVPANHIVEMWMPLEAWSILWITAGLLTLVGALVYKSTFAAFTIGLLVGLYVLWGFSYFLQSLLLGPALWASAINHWCIATIALWSVWRGSRMHLREEVATSD